MTETQHITTMNDPDTDAIENESKTAYYYVTQILRQGQAPDGVFG